MSSFQLKKNTRHIRNRKVWSTQRKKKSTKNVPQRDLIVYLLDKDFKTPFLKVLEKLKMWRASRKSYVNKTEISIKKIENPERSQTNSGAEMYWMNNWNEKNLPEGFKGLFEQVEERMSKLKDRTREIIWVLDTERKNNEGKWTAPKGLVGNSQAEQYIVGVQEEWGQAESIWSSMAQNFPNLMKNMNVNIEEAQWTPSNMDSKRSTLRPVIINFWKTKRESRKQQERSDSLYTKNPL